jgi:hypothetical protein
MKDQETVQKFIELRSQGLSFGRISAHIGVAKATLVNWSQEHQHLIQNLRTIEWEEFLDRTIASKQERLQAISDQLRRLETELAGRELSSVPTPRLQTMAEQLRRRLDREGASLQFTAGVRLSRDDDSRDAIQVWKG